LQSQYVSSGYAQNLKVVLKSIGSYRNIWNILRVFTANYAHQLSINSVGLMKQKVNTNILVGTSRLHEYNNCFNCDHVEFGDKTLLLTRVVLR